MFVYICAAEVLGLIIWINKYSFRKVSILDSVVVFWLLVKSGGDQKEVKVCNLYRKNIHNRRKERREP